MSAREDASLNGSATDTVVPSPSIIMQRRVVKRDGETIQDFDLEKITRAIRGAWLECGRALNEDALKSIAVDVANHVSNMQTPIEKIQDLVELSLMRFDYCDVAKAYILFRQRRAEDRQAMRAVDPQAIADYIHPAKYARYLPEKKRREVFEETVSRVESMHLKTFAGKGVDEEIKWAFDIVREKRVLPSMRSMQFGGKAIEKTHSRQYNCSYTLIDRPRVFGEILYLLLCGCGVGYSVQFDHVEKLPVLKRVDRNEVYHHTVEDTIEGWAEALNELIQGHTAGYYVEFNYSQIRPIGAPLRISGGKAPGHLGLRGALESIRGILEGAAGRQLRPIEAHDILCHAADAVLSGGVRRSALISLFSPDDGEMMNAKTGKWYETVPWRMNANNSAVFVRKEVTEQQFKRLFKATKQFGEPGFVFTNDRNYGTNPCFAPETRLATKAGSFKIEDLFKQGAPINVVADNRVGKGDTVIEGRFGVRLLPATAAKLTQKQAKLFCVETAHGYTVTATENHDFITTQGRKPLRDLKCGDVLLLPSGEGSFGTVGSFEEGFILGLYVGDGTSVHKEQLAFVDIWEDDFQDADAIKVMVNGIITKIPTFNGSRDYGEMAWQIGEDGAKKRIGGVRLYRWLKGLANNERVETLKEGIPESVWQGSKEFVAGYLQGFFYADGTLNVGGHGTKQTVSWRLGQANHSLMKEVQQLLTQFGIVSRVYLRREEGVRELPDGKGGTAEDFFEIIVNRPNLITFKNRIGLYGRKGDLVALALKNRGEECRKPERFITTIETITEAGISDVYCLTQPETNSVIANGVVVGQCGEIGLDPILVVDDLMASVLHDHNVKANIGDRLTGFAFCNLTTINAAKLKTFQDFKQAAKAATIIGTLQAAYTDFSFLGPVSEQIARRDALLGVSMTGMFDSPQIACNPIYQREISSKIIEWNREFAARINVNSAARTTCVKPEGSSSLALGGVATGHHAHHAKRYIRRVTANEFEPVFRYFRSINPNMCVRKPNGDWIIEFLIQAPEGAIFKDDMSAIEFLDKIRSTQQNWVVPGTARTEDSPGLNHNVSNTVQVRDHEWNAVADYLWKYRDEFTAVALLPNVGDKIYAFAPNEAITTEGDETRWRQIIANYKPVDYTQMMEEDDMTDLAGEVACAGGACALV